MFAYQIIRLRYAAKAKRQKYELIIYIKNV